MFKKNDVIIYTKQDSIDYGKVFKVKYILNNFIVVNCSILGVDFPISFDHCVLYSALTKELM
jgi:hypothetical protein